METPNEIQAINADEIVIEVPPQKRPAERSSAKKRPAKRAGKDTQETASLTDDQKRLARNAALREWRKKNAARVKAYMTEWRAKRKGTEPKSVEPKRDRAEQTSSPATGAVLSTATKKSTSKKSKKSKKGSKA
jgi:hypothetical protein